MREQSYVYAEMSSNRSSNSRQRGHESEECNLCPVENESLLLYGILRGGGGGGTWGMVRTVAMKFGLGESSAYIMILELVDSVVRHQHECISFQFLRMKPTTPLLNLHEFQISCDWLVTRWELM